MKVLTQNKVLTQKQKKRLQQQEREQQRKAAVRAQNSSFLRRETGQNLCAKKQQPTSEQTE